MKKLTITAMILCFSTSAFADFECVCELDFKRNDTGEVYTEEVSVYCPQTDDESTLLCEGDVFANTLTTTCINDETGDEESDSGWTQWNARPTTSWPDCQLW